MCSPGDQTELNTEELMNQFSHTLVGSFSQAFGSAQSVLKSLTGQLQQMVTNPHGFDPKTLASMRTSAADNTATNFAHAASAAGAYSAARGGADLGSGVASQIAGQVGTAGAQQLSNEQNQININNGMLQNQNLWSGIQGLQQVGSIQANLASGAASAAPGAAKASTDAGQAFLASRQTERANFFQDLSTGVSLAGTAISMGAGVAGLAGAGKAASGPALGGGMSEADGLGDF